MDTLALLCNLYGDGPQTLRRLREAGCGTLAALETLESERLASLLRTSVRAAKRFQAEGRLLRERSEPSGERATARRHASEPGTPVQQANPLVASVLAAWRERDAVAGDTQGGVGAGTLVIESRAPSGAASETGVGLEALDGMDAALLDRLREAGVDTLEALCEADVLDLAGRGLAGYTRLLHLQFLARRSSGLRPRVGGAAPAPAAPPFPGAAPARESGTIRAEPDPWPARTGPRPPAVATLATSDVAAVEAEAPEAPTSVDLLVPLRPLERRGVGRFPAAPIGPAESRFSPRAEPYEPVKLPLEAELDRRAALRRAGEALDPGIGADDDAGSSGPFA